MKIDKDLSHPLILKEGEMNFTEISDKIDDGISVTEEEQKFYNEVSKNINEYKKI